MHLLFCHLYSFGKQTMLITVKANFTSFGHFKPCLCTGFGIKLNKLNLVGGDICYKRNIMLLCHRVADGNIIVHFAISFHQKDTTEN